jgi:hypothetical protein
VREQKTGVIAWLHILKVNCDSSSKFLLKELAVAMTWRLVLLLNSQSMHVFVQLSQECLQDFLCLSCVAAVHTLLCQIKKHTNFNMCRHSKTATSCAGMFDLLNMIHAILYACCLQRTCKSQPVVLIAKN